MSKKIENRFEPVDEFNVCNNCVWIDEVQDTDFPCSHCIHNANHLSELELAEQTSKEND